MVFYKHISVLTRVSGFNRCFISCSRYDEDLAQSDPVTFDPKNKLGPGAMGVRGIREQKGRPSPATWK